MELKIKEIQLPDTITFNYQELKQEIEAKSHQYTLAVYSEDQIKLAKSDRANLNKLKKALNDERIRQEKEYMKPFNDFKAKINELISIIDKPVQLIDSQVKNYEEKQKQEKKDKIFCYFESGDYPEWLEFDMIFNEKWLNASVKMSAIETEINARLEQIKTDLETLSRLPEFAFEATEIYKNTLDINKAISEGHRLSEIAKRKAEAEARAKVETIQPEEIVNPASADCSEIVNEISEPEKEWISFKALLSTEDALALRDFFNSRRIEFEAI